MKVILAPLKQPISVMVGSTPSAAILDYWQDTSSEVYVGYIEDRFVCCWGIIPPTVFSNTAYLWMYHTEELSRHPFVFIRQSQIEMKRLLHMYPTITGHCVLGNHRAMRWLRWLGAEFHPMHKGLRPFTIRRRTDG